MQEIYKLNPAASIKATLPQMQATIESALSNNSGNQFPTNNLKTEMVCYRTDLRAFYLLESLSPLTWTKIIDLNNAFGNAATLSGKFATEFAPSGFGIGSTSSALTDLNLFPGGGLFAVATNCANAPIVDYGFVMIIKNGDSKFFQMFTPQGSSDNNAKGKIYTRIGVSNVWSPWKELAFTTGQVDTAKNAEKLNGKIAGNAAGEILVLDSNAKVPANNMPVATKTSVGGIKLGKNLNISEDGTVDAQPGGISLVSQVTVTASEETNFAGDPYAYGVTTGGSVLTKLAGIQAGTYTLQTLLQSLVAKSHTHSSQAMNSTACQCACACQCDCDCDCTSGDS